MNKKLKMARKMMTTKEIKEHISPFLSHAWNERKYDISLKVKEQQGSAHQRAEARRAEAKKLEMPYKEYLINLRLAKS